MLHISNDGQISVGIMQSKRSTSVLKLFVSKFKKKPSSVTGFVPSPRKLTAAEGKLRFNPKKFTKDNKHFQSKS